MVITGFKWNDTVQRLIGVEPLKDFYKIRIVDGGDVIECKFATTTETHQRYIIDVIHELCGDRPESVSFFANIKLDDAHQWRVLDMIRYINTERGDK